MASCPKRILIVEDNKLDAKLLKDILETRKRSVRSACR
jgi:CheY-like chemotaxis protein